MEIKGAKGEGERDVWRMRVFEEREKTDLMVVVVKGG